MDNSVGLNIRIQRELYEQLKELAKRQNISLASVVRIACSDYVEKNKK